MPKTPYITANAVGYQLSHHQFYVFGLDQSTGPGHGSGSMIAWKLGLPMGVIAHRTSRQGNNAIPVQIRGLSYVNPMYG